MATSYLHGNPIYWKNKQWYYVDTGEPTADHWQERACGHCGRHITPEGHDGCLGTLPKVRNACCGHGQVEETYVQLVPGVEIRGAEAIKLIERLKAKT